MAESIGLKAVLDLSQWNKGIASYTGSIEQMTKVTGSAGKTLSGQFVGLGQSILDLGATAAKVAAGGIAVLGTALAGFAISGIQQAASLDQQMSDIASVMGKTKDAVTPLKDEILKLSIDPQLKVNATEAANAIEMLAKNGLTMTDILNGAAKSTVALANATRADFGTAADIATDVMNVFNVNAANMGTAIDGITGVTTHSKLTIDDYALALSSAGAVAEGMGVSLQDFNTVLAATASSFSSGRVAGTSLKVLLQRLANPTDEMQAAMAEFGISLFDSEGNMRGLGEVAQQLNNVFQGTATITSTVGGATKEQAKAAEEAARKIDGLRASIATNQSQLQLYNDQLALEIQYYGEGSPKVRQRQIQIEKLQNTINGQNRTMSEYEAAIQAVDGAQAKQITTTKNLTEAEKAKLAAVLGGADGARQIIALSKLTSDEFDALSQSVNANGQALQAAATRVDSLQGAWEIFMSVIQAIQIQVGDKFLPILRSVTAAFAQMASEQGPAIVAFFGQVADVIGQVINTLANFGAAGAGTSILSMLGFDQGQIAQVLVLIDSLVTKVTRTLASLGSAVASSLGGPLSDFANNLAPMVINVLTFINDHFAEFQGALMGIGAVLAGGVIAAVAAALVSLLTPINLIIAAAALLGAAWVGNWGGIRDTTLAAWSAMQPFLMQLVEWLQVNLPVAIQTVSDIWTSTMLPALILIGTWLGTNLPIAIQTVSDLWANVLLPAIIDVSTWIVGTLIPTLTVLGTWLSVNITNAVATLSAAWTGTLLPALTTIGTFITGSLMPLFAAFGNLVGAVVNKAVEAMAALWLNVLFPAFNRIWSLISGSLLPVFGDISDVLQRSLMPPLNTVANDILPAMEEGLKTVSEWVQKLTDYFNTLVSAVNSFSIPNALAEHSPSEMTLSLIHVGDAATEAGQTLSNAFSNVNVTSSKFISQLTKSIDLMGQLNRTGQVNRAQQRNVERIFANMLPGIAPALGAGTFTAQDLNSLVGTTVAGFNIPPSVVNSYIDFNGVVGDLTDSFQELQRTIRLENIGKALGAAGQLAQFGTSAADRLAARIENLQKLTETGGLFEGQEISATDAQYKLNSALAEQARVQKEILDLQRQQADLQFLQQQVSLLQMIKDAGLKASDVLGNIKLGVNADLGGIVQAMNKVVQAMINQANEDITGIGMRRGVGFQAGTPSNTGNMFGLGYRIPAGYPNDSFGPLFAQTGEEMLVTPRGTSIQDMILSRLGNLLQGAAVQGNPVTNVTNYNFDMTVNSGASPQGVIQQYGIMKGLVSA